MYGPHIAATVRFVKQVLDETLAERKLTCRREEKKARKLLRDQQALREGPFAVNPLGVAAEAGARGHLHDCFGEVFV